MHRSLIALALLGLLAACGNDNTNTDTGDDDTGVDDTSVDTDQPDTDEPDTTDDTDVADDVEHCIPGYTRCVNEGEPSLEVCDDGGVWVLEQCGDGDVCERGVCGHAGACGALAVTACLGYDRYEGCNASGFAEGEWAVPPDLTCVDGESGPELVSRECFAGQTRCADEQVLEACGESGLEWTFATNCQSDDGTTLCDAGQCVPLCEYIAKRDTYVGCEYWALDLDNALVRGGGSNPYYDAAGAQFAVVVSNVTETIAAEVTVDMRDQTVATVSVEPGALEVINLPARDIDGTMRGFEAYRVSSTVPIIAYQFNPLANEQVFSNDASLLFPSSSFGTEYIVMTRRQTFDQLKGYVTIAAPMAGETEVTITLPPYTPENPVQTLGGDGIDPMRGGDVLNVVLQQYEVINIETNRAGADLTGTVVESNRPIVVFGGSEAANAPNDDSCVYRARQDDWVCAADRETPCINAADEPDISLCSSFITCCADHLEHQMLPIFAWGSEFNATRSVPRGDEADVWRVLAGSDGVTVTLEGLPEMWDLPFMIPAQREWTLDETEWFEVQSPVDFEIHADGPVMVGQFLAAEQAPYPSPIDADMPDHEDAGTGDPAFILVPPVEQYRDEYTFLAPDAYEHDHVVITAPVGAVVELDGEVIADDAWVLFGDEEFHVARMEIADGTHTVTADQGVGVVVMGYDQYVSYGYAGGLDIREIFRR